MTSERRSYTEEYKREAVRLLESKKKSAAQIARDLGITDKNLYRWRKHYGEEAEASGGSGSRAGLEAEVKRLQREVEVLRQERDILKKAMHIVSRSQP